MSAYHEYPETFSERAVNTVWRLIYVLVLHYILFEFTLPYIGKKRTSVIPNIFIAIPLVFVHAMLYSWGLFGWRALGIALDIYTPLKTFESGDEGATEQMAFSMMSIFFFAIVRHIFFYYRLR